MSFNNLTLSEKLDLYEKGYKNLKTFLESLPVDSLTFSPDPENHWNIKKIAIHLTDTEGVFFVRFRQILSQPGLDFLRVGQDNWDKPLVYSGQDLNLNLQVLETLRLSNFTLLKSIPATDWKEKTFKLNNELFPLEAALSRNLMHFYHHFDIIKKRYNQYNEQH